MKCVRCGCTEEKACIQFDTEGVPRGCSWVHKEGQRPLCSGCQHQQPVADAAPLHGYVARPRGTIIYGPEAHAQTELLLKELARESRWLAKARKGLRDIAAMHPSDWHRELFTGLADSIDGRKTRVKR